MSYLVTDRKFYRQIVNGEDFSLNTGTYTTFLKSNLPELIKAVVTCQFSWQSLASDFNIFTVVNNQIERVSGSFLDDGFIAGDIIDVINDTTPFASDRTITFVDDTILVYSGALDSITSANLKVKGKTALRGFNLKYNLIENSASKSFASLQDGSLMAWSVEGVGAGAVGARLTAFVDGSWNSNSLTGKTGSFKIKFVQDVDAYTQQFQFEHVFRNIPFFLDGERANWLGGINITPLLNDSCLKYIFDLKGGVTSQNPNEIKIVEDNELLGNTGGFNETFNGGLPNFAIESIEYTDGVTGLVVTEISGTGPTHVEIIINSPTSINLNANHAVMVYLARLTADADIVTTDDFDENWVFDSKRQVRNGASVDGVTIQDLLVIGASGNTKLQVNFTIDFTTAQKNRLTNGDDFTVMIEVDDINNLGLYSTTLKDDTTIQISADVEGLYEVTEFGLYRQDMEVGVDTPFTSYKGFIEDTVLLELFFGLDISLFAKIQKMRFKLIAFQTVTEEYFLINQDEIGLSTAPLSGDTQQINFTKTQPFQIPVTSPFKFITVVNDSTVGDQEIYRVRYPFKLNWMDYKALPAADGVFFDSAELNDGLNQDISRYSGVSNYQILLQIEADVKDANDNTTVYIDRTPYFDVRHYENDTPLNQFSALAIQVLTLGGVALPDNQIVKDRDNLIRATYTYNTPIATSIDVGGLIKFEKYQNGGLPIQAEINSWDVPGSFNIFQPKTGQTKLHVVNNGTTVVMECIIPEVFAAALPDGFISMISSRIMKDVAVIANAKQKEDGVLKQKEDGNFKFKE